MKGWKESQALGADLGAVIRDYEQNQQTPRVDSPLQDASDMRDFFMAESHCLQRKKSVNVIIHSSPYKRCVQTALAVGAGLGMALEDGLVRAVNAEDDLVPLKEEHNAHHSLRARRIKLRLDAFLGEWLTPDYFNHSASSPNTAEMISAAKVNLLRRPEVSEEAQMLLNNIQNADFEVKKRQYSDYDNGDFFFNGMTKTFSTGAKSDHSIDYQRSPQFINDLAASNHQPIFESLPAGLAEHASSAFVEFDHQWDSTRQAMRENDGEELEETWGAMHSRFRNGLRELLSSYTMESLQKPSHAGHPQSIASEKELENETVLVIVTHGSGCNALIGTMANQPAVLEVDTSSLTMFVRKDSASSHALDASSDEPHSANIRSANLNRAVDDLSSLYQLNFLTVKSLRRPDLWPLEPFRNPLVSTSSIGQLDRKESLNGSKVLAGGIPSLKGSFVSHEQSGYFKGLNGIGSDSNRSGVRYPLDVPNAPISTMGCLASSGCWAGYDVARDASGDDKSDLSDDFLLNFDNV